MAEPIRHLRRPPLAEALLEVKWAIPPQGDQQTSDPGYPLIVGRLYDRVQTDYPEVEDLVPQHVPVSMTPNVVRHRFRRAKGQWPLVQVGPGVLTLNETHAYRWNKFRDMAIALLPKLYEAYPAEHTLDVQRLTLRYINALEFDFENADALEFLESRMRTVLRLPPEFFANGNVRKQPIGLRLNLTFPAAAPKGVLELRFGIGQSNDRPALLWEFVVRSWNADVPKLPLEFPTWLDQAHDLVEGWFFELVKGELLTEFDRP